jgi:hypothetical protein
MLAWCVKGMRSLFALSVKFPQLSASKYNCVTSQCSQLIGPSTSHDNGTDERKEEIVHIGLGRASSKFVWENMDSFPTPWETFCNAYGPQFDTAELDVVSVFENIFYLFSLALSCARHTFSVRSWLLPHGGNTLQEISFLESFRQ